MTDSRRSLHEAAQSTWLWTGSLLWSKGRMKMLDHLGKGENVKMLDTIHNALLENGKRVFLTLPKLTSEGKYPAAPPILLLQG